VALSALVVLSCYSVFSQWVPHVGHQGSRGEVGEHCYSVAAFDSLVDGTAHKPFVTRMLVFSYVRVAAAYASPQLISWLEQPLRWLGWGRLLYPPDFVSRPHLVLWYWMILGSLLLLVEGLRRFLRALYDAPAGTHLVWACVALSLWPLLHRYYAYPYDPFTPTIFCWTLYAAYRRRRVLYFGLLLLAALHKETAVAIPLAVAYMDRGTEPPLASAARAVGCCAGVLAVRLALSGLLFSDSVGGFVEFHLLSHNLTWWRLTQSWSVALLLAVLIWALALRDWNTKPRGARAAALVVVPLLLLAVPFGFIDELRQYAEGLPGLAALAFPTVLGPLVTVSPRPRPELQGSGWLATAAQVGLVLLLLVPVAVRVGTPPRTFQALKVVDLAQLSAVRPEGTPVTEEGVARIPSHTRLQVPLAGQPSLRGYELSLDCNDRYKVVLRGAEGGRAFLHGPAEGRCQGLAVYWVRLRTPLKRPARLEVTPVSGDGTYAVGHLRLNPPPRAAPAP